MYVCSLLTYHIFGIGALCVCMFGTPALSKMYDSKSGELSNQLFQLLPEKGYTQLSYY